MPVQRTCRCGCLRLFSPSVKRPGQEYIHGHNPKLGLVPKRAPDLEPERRLLDYKMALATAQREADDVAKAIDSADDELVPLYARVKALQILKETLSDRHAGIIVTIEALKALIAGKGATAMAEAS